MSNDFPLVYLARHGQTAWSITGQHTGLADLPLTEQGEEEARRLGARLQKFKFDYVFVSPLQRAMNTCEIGGYAGVAEVMPDLVEWHYGKYEGRRTAEILAARPDWDLFRDGCPDGESPEQVGVRADRVVQRLRQIGGKSLLFSSGHFLRVLAARWLSLPSSGGRCFHLSTASLSVLGYEHSRARSVIELWNDVSHLVAE